MILVLISNISPDVKFGIAKIVTVSSSDCVWSQIFVPRTDFWPSTITY